MTEPKVTLTPETAAFLREVLSTVTLKAGDANFEAVTAAIIQAKKELGGT